MQSLKFGWLALWVLMCTNLSAQENIFAADHYGNLYYTEGNVLKKVMADSSGSYHFDIPESSYISSIDVTNPMRIMVFSNVFNSILFLDNRLAPLGDAFMLEDKGFFNIPVACYAARGGFWIYDGDKHKIRHIDKTGTTDIESGELPASNQDPVFIKEVNSYVYLGFSQKGILVFNTYGAYVKTLPLEHDRAAEINESFIVYSRSGHLFVYDRLNFENDSITICQNKISGYALLGNELLIRCGETFVTCKLER